MNANEISHQKDASRLQRIKVVSRLARYICYIFLAYSVFFFLSSLMSFFMAQRVNAGIRDFFIVAFEAVLLAWYWNLSKLFSSYERGQIFAAATIRRIKILGVLFVAGWFLTSALHLLPLSSYEAMPPPLPGQNATGTTDIVSVVRVETHLFRMGFFSFDFGTGIDFGLLLAGAVIILIAWIMDEGRKLQEEQELTV